MRGFNSEGSGPETSDTFTTDEVDEELPPPSNIQLTATATRIRVTFNLVQGASGCEIEYGPGIEGTPGEGENYTIIDVGNVDQYTITGLDPETWYDVRVRAY